MHPELIEGLQGVAYDGVGQHHLIGFAVETLRRLYIRLQRWRSGGVGPEELAHNELRGRVLQEQRIVAEVQRQI